MQNTLGNIPPRSRDFCFPAQNTLRFYSSFLRRETNIFQTLLLAFNFVVSNEKLYEPQDRTYIYGSSLGRLACSSGILADLRAWSLADFHCQRSTLLSRYTSDVVVNTKQLLIPRTPSPWSSLSQRRTRRRVSARNPGSA